jgi:SPP1 family predicted phage head-tail adaptor
MSIGSMSERITLQEPNKLPNGQGGFKIDKANPVIIGEYWAGVEYLSGIEAIKYGGKRSEDYIKFEIRNNSRLNKSCQVVYKSQVLEVEEITPAKNKPGFTWVYAREAI